MKQKDYTIKELSEISGIRRSTIDRWINCKWLKATPKKCRGYLIYRQDLRDFFSNPPHSATRGLIALIDRDILEELIGEEVEPKNRANCRGYRTPIRSIGWTLP